MAPEQEDIVRVSSSALVDHSAFARAEGNAFLCEDAIRREDQHIALPVLVTAAKQLRGLNLRQVEQKPERGPRIGAPLQVPAYPVEFYWCYPVPHAMRSRNCQNHHQYQHGSEPACTSNTQSFKSSTPL
ncbi:hypothetical protein [Enterobacter kobei]|uniref:hypothetical protein n=1 Tax=Enterobacter kobei TaxID=208224 RepID=UPI003CF86A6B